MVLFLAACVGFFIRVMTIAFIKHKPEAGEAAVGAFVVGATKPRADTAASSTTCQRPVAITVGR